MSLCIRKRSPESLLNLLLAFCLLFYSLQAWAPFNRFGTSLRNHYIYLLVSVSRNGANQPLAWVATNQIIHPAAPAPASNILSHHVSPITQGSSLPLANCPHLDESAWQQLPLGSIHTSLQHSSTTQYTRHQVEIDTSTTTAPDDPVVEAVVQVLGQLDIQLIQQIPELCSHESRLVTITQAPRPNRQPASHSYFNLLQQVRVWLNPAQGAVSQASTSMSGELPLIRPRSSYTTPFIIRNSRTECPSIHGSYRRLSGCEHNIGDLQYSFVSPPAMVPPEVTAIHNQISGATTINASPAPGNSWWCNFMQVTEAAGQHYVVVGSAGGSSTFALVPVWLAINPFRWILNPRSCAQQAGKPDPCNPDDHQPPPPGAM